MNKLIFISILFLILNNCSNKINYSGKILDLENLENFNFQNKQILLNKLGSPSFEDPITKKYFYFSEKKEKQSIFRKEIKYSFIFVFEFDENEKIIKSKVIDLKDTKNIKLIKEETPSEVIQRGLLEKIFGGVGPQQEITTSP